MADTPKGSQTGPSVPGLPPPGPAPAAAPEPLPPELQSANVSKDERTWGMVGHLAALAGLTQIPFANVLGPLIVWLIKREESKFVAFHAKQCMWLHIFASIAALVMILLGLVLCFPFVIAVLITLSAIGYSIYGAIQVSGGKDFEYYWIGPWVRRSMM